MNRYNVWVVAGCVLVSGLIGPASTGAEGPPRQVPTIRFVIPGLEQTRAAQSTPVARKSPTPATGDYWWNQEEYTEAFGFSEDQRKRMDAAMADVAEKTNEAVRQQNAARDRFHQAVKERNWTAARTASEEWERAFAAQWGVANRAKLAILQLLTPEQHEKLFRDYPYLLDRPWTVGRRLEVRRGTPGTSVPSTPGPTAPAP
jgi:hypothetical protein